MKAKDMPALRKLGYKIRVTHFRVTQHGTFSRRQIDEENTSPGNLNPKHIIQPCGGRVECDIEAPDGMYRTKGIAVVGSKAPRLKLSPGQQMEVTELRLTPRRKDSDAKENFHRKIGTQMAFGRAWKPFLHLGKQVEEAWPNGTDVANRHTKDIGTVMGSYRVIDEIVGPSPYSTCSHVEYVILWNGDSTKTLVCIHGKELESVDLKNYGLR